MRGWGVARRFWRAAKGKAGGWVVRGAGERVRPRAAAGAAEGRQRRVAWRRHAMEVRETWLGLGRQGRRGLLGRIEPRGMARGVAGGRLGEPRRVAGGRWGVEAGRLGGKRIESGGADTQRRHVPDAQSERGDQRGGHAPRGGGRRRRGHSGRHSRRHSGGKLRPGQLEPLRGAAPQQSTRWWEEARRWAEGRRCTRAAAPHARGLSGGGAPEACG